MNDLSSLTDIELKAELERRLDERTMGIGKAIVQGDLKEAQRLFELVQPNANSPVLAQLLAPTATEPTKAHKQVGNKPSQTKCALQSAIKKRRLKIKPLIDDKSPSEIAEFLNIPVNTVYKDRLLIRAGKVKRNVRTSTRKHVEDRRLMVIDLIDQRKMDMDAAVKELRASGIDCTYQTLWNDMQYLGLKRN